MELQDKLGKIVQDRLNLDPAVDLAPEARACVVPAEGLRQAIQEAYALGKSEAVKPAGTTD